MSDKRPQLLWISVKDLRIMTRGNRRTVNTAFIKHLADHFDPDLLGTFEVAPNDGKGRYAIIDGQHRWKALTEHLGWTDQKVPCLVIQNAADVQVQAKVFEGLQHRLNVRPVDSFLNRVIAGNPTDVEIDKIVKSFGLQVGHTTSDNTISAVRVLERIFAQQGADGLTAAMTTSLDAWGKGQAPLHGHVLSGIAMVFHRYNGQIDRDTLVKKLRQFPGGADALVAKAKGSRELHGSTVPQNVAGLIVGAYNKHRHAQTSLPSWWSA